MVRLVSKFMNKNDLTISPAARRRALSFCLVQRYAFANMMGESALGCPRIIGVVEQMELGHNPAPLILAETIIGLDRRFTSRTHEYRGCPRILQVWLMERLGVLNAVVNMETYNVSGVTTRALDWAGVKRRSPNYFKEFIRSRTLKWVVPWWGIKEFSATSALNASSGLMLCGFDLGVWIHPLRVKRQMGLAQTIPKEDTRIMASMQLDVALVNDWVMRWDNRATWNVPAACATIWVSGAYVRWTTSRDGRENARLREDEKLDISNRMLRTQKDAGVGPSRFHSLGKRKMVDGPSKGVPVAKSVHERIGGASTSKVESKSSSYGVFDRLGDKAHVLDRLGEPSKVIVCGLPARRKAKDLKCKPIGAKYVVKSQVVVLAEEDDSDGDADKNPKRKCKKD